MPIQIPKCNKCGTTMLLKEKDDSKFWGCPKYKICGGKTLPYYGVDTLPQALQDSPRLGKTKDEVIYESLQRIEQKLNKVLGITE